jgi:hypothetical protein
VSATDEVVRRDGVSVDRAAWESAIPVDPGEHTISAEAPGHASWSTTVSASDPGKTVTVDVPALAEIAPPPRSSSPTDASATATPSPDAGVASRAKTQRWVGLVLGGAGIVGMGVSGAMGLVAKSQFNTATGESGPARHTDSVGAGGLADAATVVLVTGAVLTAAGVVVWLTAPKAPVAVGTNGSAVFLAGSFQ